MRAVDAIVPRSGPTKGPSGLGDGGQEIWAGQRLLSIFVPDVFCPFQSFLRFWQPSRIRATHERQKKDSNDEQSTENRRTRDERERGRPSCFELRAPASRPRRRQARVFSPSASTTPPLPTAPAPARTPSPRHPHKAGPSDEHGRLGDRDRPRFGHRPSPRRSALIPFTSTPSARQSSPFFPIFCPSFLRCSMARCVVATVVGVLRWPLGALCRPRSLHPSNDSPIRNAGAGASDDGRPSLHDPACALSDVQNDARTPFLGRTATRERPITPLCPCSAIPRYL